MLARLSSRGFDDPWMGLWHDPQPSVFNGACSNTNGPDFSAWHLKHTWSCAAVVRSSFDRKPPCELWQSLHCSIPSFTGS